MTSGALGASKDDMRITMYGTSYCGYCQRAEELLRRRNIPFELVDVTDDLVARAELVERANGRRTVPVIFIDREPIGGYEELARMSATGELDRRLGFAESGGDARPGLPMRRGA